MTGTGFVEVERKFLVADLAAALSAAGPPTAFRQGYLSIDPDATVRVRIAPAEAWLTVKGRAEGIVRTEVEVPLTRGSAEAMMGLCRWSVEKERRRIAVGAHVWELDVFSGANAGLVTVEVELSSPDEAFERPAWIGAEVTDDPRHANARLAVEPYAGWGLGSTDGSTGPVPSGGVVAG